MYSGERFNSISHLVGAALAIAALVLLIVFASIDGDVWKIVSFVIYGLTLFSLYLVSTLYHSLRGRPKTIFRILDHQAIYLLIAGTYTPFALVTLRDSVGWWLFGASWTLAFIGILLDALDDGGKRVVQLIIYVVMGWMILFALDPLLAALPPAGFRWLLAGGILYSVGIAFYLLDHWYPIAHGIWHLFVLAGSVCHYFAILMYV
ncbi:MAG: hemolysin III family protein [Chromatiaceae bacterium]|nr:hemolysin III family protein [Chromatiaceae bacterium]